MGSVEHPQDQEILDYVKSPELEKFSPLRLHLSSCRYCRRRAELTALVRDQGHWLESEAVDVEESMAALMATAADTEQAELLRQQIKQDPGALRAALHFASHAQAMNSLRQELPVRTSLGLRISERLRDWLNFRAPVWQMAPAVAVVMMLATILLNLYAGDSDDQFRVVAFSDNPVIQFVGQENQPGIGFFTQRDANTKPFGAMQIELTPDRRLRLSWPEVGDAEFYSLKLQVFSNGETQVLSRQILDTTTAFVKLSEIPSTLRYEWVLSGEIDSKQSFQASGGFVIATE